MWKRKLVSASWRIPCLSLCPTTLIGMTKKMERSFCLSAETAFGGITRRRGLWSECRLPRKRIYLPYFWIHTEGLGCRSIIKVFIATTAKDGWLSTWKHRSAWRIMSCRICGKRMVNFGWRPTEEASIFITMPPSPWKGSCTFRAIVILFRWTLLPACISTMKEIFGLVVF